VKDQCATEYTALDDGCKLCLAANTTSPLKCAAWRAPLFANQGRNGLLLVSRLPIEDASYTAFETYVVKRGVIAARVGGVPIQCTHMSADLESVPYPSGGRFGSWRAEHQAQIAVMTEQAGPGCAVMLGDLNAGPPGQGIDGELADNFRAVTDAGWIDGWTANQVCTFCGENPLVCSNASRCGDISSRIDHILFHGCETTSGADYRRIADRPVTITGPDGVEHEGRASDHYGVAAALL
jgi:endonuclease/exonuclease/phosphatase family metal-dependent hydrolase